MATISTKNKLLAKWPLQPFATLSHVPFFAVCGPSWDEGNVSLEQGVLPQLHIAAAQPASSINSCSCCHLPRRQKWYTGLAAARWRWQWYRCYIWDTDWFQRQETRPLAETPCKHPPPRQRDEFPTAKQPAALLCRSRQWNLQREAAGTWRQLSRADSAVPIWHVVMHLGMKWLKSAPLDEPGRSGYGINEHRAMSQGLCGCGQTPSPGPLERVSAPTCSSSPWP